jgi:hypothetical protein
MGASGSAYADGGAPPAKGATADEARADAQKRLDEGLNRYAKGDYEGARLAFAQAYAVLTSIDLLYNLSRAEVKSGHPLEAIVHIRQMLRDPTATTEDKAKAQNLLDEANRFTGHIAVEAPDGAQIFLDHVDSGEAPIRDPYDVAPGKHVVEARGGGGARVVEVDAPAGDVVTTHFALAMGAPPTVSAPVPLPPPLPEPSTAPAPATEERERHHDSAARVIVPVVLGAVGVIGLGVGIGLGVASQGKQNDATAFRADNPTGFCANQASASCLQYQSILTSQQQDTNLSRGMLIGGGVFVVAAAVTYLVWPRHHDHEGEKSATWLVPVPGGVGGSF